MKSEYLRVFRAFSDENRVRILEMLLGGEHCACQLLHELQISQPTLSHHIKILTASGIVKTRKAGKWSYYSINTEGCDYAVRLLEHLKKGRAPLSLRMARSARRFLGYVSGMKDPHATATSLPCCSRN
ncbi:MAG TPA: winged helix-turn-helix transcriptional regulator [Papillibacter sp.]|jgi:ArsR family transcriptional regulator|nr:winged helix-turn-helix transcriptional regulator [Papillibacter sp.]